MIRMTRSWRLSSGGGWSARVIGCLPSARDLLAARYERSAGCFMKRAESELEVAADALKEQMRVVPVPWVVLWAHAYLKRVEKRPASELEIAADVLVEADV